MSTKNPETRLLGGPPAGNRNVTYLIEAWPFAGRCGTLCAVRFQDLGDYRAGVLASLVECNEVLFLAGACVACRGACRWPWRSAYLRGYGHAGEVGFRLRYRGQDVEQQAADRIGGVVDGSDETSMSRLVRSSTMSRAPGRERARPSSSLTARVSPTRHAARVWFSPGRSRFRPVSPWSTWTRSSGRQGT